MTTTHTAGPWAVRIEPDEDSCTGQYVYEVKEANRADILGICELNRYNKSHETLVANADFIVRACNAHEGMVEALKVAHAELTLAPTARAIVEAALALAEGTVSVDAR